MNLEGLEVGQVDAGHVVLLSLDLDLGLGGGGCGAVDWSEVATLLTFCRTAWLKSWPAANLASAREKEASWSSGQYLKLEARNLKSIFKPRG
jgi:hypothetical protein